MANGGDIKFRVGFQTQTQSLNKLKTSLQELQKIKMGDFSGSKKDLDNLTQSAKKVEVALQRAFNVKLGSLNIGTFKQELAQAGTSVEKIYASFSKAGTQGKIAFNQMASQVLTTNLQLRQTSHLIQDIGDTMAKTVKWGIASSIMNNFTNSVKSAFTYVKALDTSLTDIRIVTGDSTEQMAQFAVQANKAAQALGRSTMDYTKSALTFYQQGLDPETVATRTQAVLKAQNITGTGSQMADYLTSVWNGYKVANEQAQLYVDKLAAVADSSASNMSQLAIAMSKVASTANVMGVDVDQLASMLATVVATTRQAPESVGTAFKTILTRLNDIKTGAEDAETSLGNYSKQMATLGFNVLDASGNLRDTGEVMEEIGSSWANLTKQQQVYLARTMGGQRQITQVMALFDNWNTYTKLLNISLESEGTLMEKNGRYMDSMAARMQKLGAATERIKDSLMNEDDLKGLIDGLTSVTSLVGSFVDSVGGGRTILLALGSTFTQVFSGTIAKQIGGIITNIQNAKYNLEQMKNQIAITEQFSKVANAQNLNKNDKNTALISFTQRTQEAQRYYSVMSEGQINAQKMRIRALAQAENEVMIWRQKKDVADVVAKNIVKDQSLLAKLYEKDSLAQEKIKENFLQVENAVKKVKNALAGDVNSGNYITNLKNSARALQRQLEQTGLVGKTQIDKLTNSIKLVKGPVNANSTAVLKLKADMQDMAKAGQQGMHEVLDALENYQEGLSNAQKKAKQYADVIKEVNKQGALVFTTKQIVSFVSGLGQIVSAYQSIIRIQQIWEDETLSSSEKVLQTITNLSMALPMLLSGITTVGGALKGLGTVLVGIGTQSLGVAAAGLSSFTLGVEGLITVLGNFLVTAAPVIAVLGGIAFGAYKLYQWWNKEAKAAEQAAQAAEKAKKSYQDLKQAQDNLISSFDRYHQLQNTIQNLTQDQKEWQKAIKDSNNAVIDLMKTYPQLTKYVQRVNGQLKISEQGQRQLLDLQQKRVDLAKETSDILDMEAQKAALSAQATQIGQKSALTNSSFYVDSIIDYLKKNNINEGQLDLENVSNLAEKIQEQTGASRDVIAAILQHSSPDILTLSEKIENNAQYTKLLYEQMASDAGIASKMPGYEDLSQLEQGMIARGAGYQFSEVYSKMQIGEKSIIKGFKDEDKNSISNSIKTLNSYLGTNYAYGGKEGQNIILLQNGQKETYTAQQLATALTVQKTKNYNYDKFYNSMQNFFGKIDNYSNSKTQQGLIKSFLSQGKVDQTISLNELDTILEKTSTGGFFSKNNEDILKELFGQNNITTVRNQYENLLEDQSMLMHRVVDSLPENIKEAFNTLDREVNLTDEERQAIRDSIMAQYKAVNPTQYIQGGPSQQQQYQDWLDNINSLSLDQFFSAEHGDFLDSIIAATMQKYEQESIKVPMSFIGELTGDLTRAYKEGGQTALDDLTNFYLNISDFGGFQSLISSYNQEALSIEGLITQMEAAGIATNITTEALQKYIKWKYQQEKVELDPQETFKSIHDIIDKLKDNDAITKEQVETLQKYGVSVEDYFTRLADGTFKLKGSVTDFYNYANGVSLNPLKQQIQKLRTVAIPGQQYLSSQWSKRSGGDFTVFSKSVAETVGADSDYNEGWAGRDNQARFAAQMNFLSALKESDAQFLRIQEKIQQVKSKDENATFADVGLSIDQLNYISLLVQAHKEDWESVDSQIKDAAAELGIYEEQLANAATVLPRQLDEDVNKDQWEDLAEYVNKYSHQIQGLSEELLVNKQDSEDVAEAILRYDAALKEVIDNYDEWETRLTSGSVQQAAEAGGQLQDVYSDLLDLPYENLSPDFTQSIDNLHLLQQAANGSEEAYQRLRQAAYQDIITHVGIDDESLAQFDTDIMTIENTILNGIDDLEIGAHIDTAEVYTAMNQLINAADMTAKEATDLLASMGVDAQIESVQVPETQQQAFVSAVPKVDYQDVSVPSIVPNLLGLGGKGRLSSTTVKVPTISYTGVGDTVSEEGSKTVTALRVKSAKKSSGGGFKFNQSSYGGGSRGSAARTPKSSGGGGGKGGGSGKQPNQMKGQDHTIDRYHDINNQLKRLSTQYEKVSESEKDLAGQDLINNLNKQLDLLQDQIAAHQVKLDIEKDQAKELQEALKAEGAIFDDNTGALTNYAQLLSNKLNGLNSTIDYYNSLSAQQQQTYKDTVEKAKQDYKNLEQTIKRYDDLLFNEIPEQQKAIKDALDKQIDIQIQKFKTKVEVDLDLSDAIKDWNKFKKTVIDQIRDDDVVNNTIARLDDLFAYYNDLNSGGLVKSLTEQITDTLKQLEEIDTSGDSSIYGERKAEALKDLKDYADKLMDSLQDVQDVLKDVKESFFNMVDAAQDAFDEQSDEYESLSELLEHSKDTVQLLYGDEAFDKLTQYLDKQKDIDRRELEFERQQKQFWWDQMQAQKAIMDAYDKESNTYKEAEQRFKELEKHWLDGVKEFNDKVQQSIENLINSYSNAVNQIFQDLDDKLTSGKGLEFLSEEWQLINDDADRYLDKINSMYEISKLEQAYRDALKDYDGDIAAQTSLNDLMEQQLKLLRDKDRLSQYDVDRANLLLQIELKRLALQQARANKTKLRLRRDSQGNYTYQYTADEEQLSQAQKALAEAQNSLYNLDKNQYKSNLNDIYSLQTEFNDKMKQLYDEYPIWTEEAEAKRKLLIEYYEDAINGVVADNNDIRTNLTQSAFDELANLYQTDVENFKAMSAAEQEELLGNLIPQWRSGIQEMANVIAGEGGFVPACEQAFDDLKDVTQSYMDDLGTLQQVADVNFDQLGENIDLTIERTQSLIDQNQDLITSYYNEMTAIMGIVAELNDLTDAYRNAKNEAINATKAAYDYWQQQKEIQAAKSKVPYNPVATTPAVSKVNPSVAVTPVATAASASSGGSGGGSALSNVGSKITEIGSNLVNALKNAANQISLDVVKPNATQNKVVNKNLTLIGGKSAIQRYASGGYTGDWGSDGRLAILDEKQLVLNRTDTERILSAVNIVRTMDDLLSSIKNTDVTMSNMITGVLSGGTSNNNNQNVYISADFPNVESRTEIEAAFNNLINRASQYVGINRK